MASTGSTGGNDGRADRANLMVQGLGELRLKDTLLRAAAVSTPHDFGNYDGAGNASSADSTSSRNNAVGRNKGMKDPFRGDGGGSGATGHFDYASAAANPPPPPPASQQPHGAPPPPPSAAAAVLDPNPPLLDSNDEENNLRSTCDGCTTGKIKCDGGRPCKRCLRRGSECIYSEKKRCGPKRRKTASRYDSDEDGSNNGGSTTDPLGEGGSGGVGSHRVLTPREQDFLSKFCNSVNKFIPLTCLTVIRDAMNPLQLDILPGVSASEVERNIFHARKAVLLGCVAVGAVFCGDQGSAGAYMQRAQIHLKDCFDALLPEVVSCYLVMVVYHLHFMQRSKVYRYIGFALQAYRELAQSYQDGGGYVRDSVRVLSTFLHVSCNDEIRVEEIDLHAESTPEPGGGSLSRIIALFSHVLLHLYRKTKSLSSSSSSPSPDAPPAFATLAAMADEADLLLSMMEDPGSFAVIVIKTLRGYFMLMKGEEQKALGLVAKPVARALEADPGVLNFPLCWTMCQCVSVFLRRQGCDAFAEGIDGIMLPVRPTLAYADSCCGVALHVLGVYAGRLGAAPSRARPFPFPAGAGAGGDVRGFAASSPARASGSVPEVRGPAGGGAPPRQSGCYRVPQHQSEHHRKRPQSSADVGNGGAERRRGEGRGGGLGEAARGIGIGDQGNDTNIGGDHNTSCNRSVDEDGASEASATAAVGARGTSAAGVNRTDGAPSYGAPVPAATERLDRFSSMAVGLDGDHRGFSFDSAGAGPGTFFHHGPKTNSAVAATATAERLGAAAAGLGTGSGKEAATGVATAAAEARETSFAARGGREG